MRLSPCKWIERDETGRPRCEHGWAYGACGRWRCPEKTRVTQRKYEDSAKGVESRREYNKTEARIEYHRAVARDWRRLNL